MAKKYHPCKCSEYKFWYENMEHTTKCNKTTTRIFSQGHDARLKSFLIQAALREVSVTRVSAEDGDDLMRPALAHADDFGFGHMVHKAVTRHRDKLAEKAIQSDLAESADPNETESAEQDNAEIATPDSRETEPKGPPPKAKMPKAAKMSEGGVRRAKIKVGRWEYSAMIDDDGIAEYYDKKGDVKVKNQGEYTIVVH